MEGKKEVGGSSCSSSSFTSELFGSKDSAGSSSSSSGIFNSIFAPSNKAFGRESLHSQVVDKKQQDYATKPTAPDSVSWDKEGGSKSPQKRENNSFYQEQRVQPCHLSSSIYYGGQDVYNSPKTTQSSGYSTYNKDGEEDDGCASRGNWWQGSLYY